LDGAGGRQVAFVAIRIKMPAALVEIVIGIVAGN